MGIISALKNAFAARKNTIDMTEKTVYPEDFEPLGLILTGKFEQKVLGRYKRAKTEIHGYDPDCLFVYELEDYKAVCTFYAADITRCFIIKKEEDGDVVFSVTLKKGKSFLVVCDENGAPCMKKLLTITEDFFDNIDYFNNI